MLLAVVLPRALVPPSDTVTVEPAGAVPVKVTDSLEFSTPVLMAGAATAAPTDVPPKIAKVTKRNAVGEGCAE